MQHRLKIGGMPVFQSRLELNLLGRANRRFIEAMSQTLDDFHDFDLSRRGEDDIEQYLALHLKLAAFFSVNRTWLECDLGRDGLYDEVGRFLRRAACDHIRVSEATLPNRPARGGNFARIISRGDSVAEARARDNSARAVGTARAIPRARSIRHIETARLRNRNGASLIILRGHPVRIAKTARLDFRGSRRHRGRS